MFQEHKKINPAKEHRQEPLTAAQASAAQKEEFQKKGLSAEEKAEMMEALMQVPMLSGSLDISLGQLLPGMKAELPDIYVRGRAFTGLLEDLSGVEITPAPKVWDSSGKQWSPGDLQVAGYIIDFGIPIPLSGLQLQNDYGLFTLVLSWAGMEFSAKSIYPRPWSSYAAVPYADATGTWLVGLSGIQTQKIFVQFKPGAGKTWASATSMTKFKQNLWLDTSAYPSNLKASLPGGMPFWTHPGQLKDDVPVTGLSKALEAALSDAEAPITSVRISSDTPGLLGVLPSQDLSGSVKRLLALEADWGGKSNIEFDVEAGGTRTFNMTFPAQPGQYFLTRLEADCAPVFSPWAAFPGQSAMQPGAIGLKVDAQFSAARRMIFDKPVRLYGFSLLIRGAAPSSAMVLEFQGEAADAPDANNVLAACEIGPDILEAPLPEGTPANTPYWVDALFEEPLAVQAGTCGWLAAKAKTGAMEWAAVSIPDGSQDRTAVCQEGAYWRPYPAMAGMGQTTQQPLAQVRILRAPEAGDSLDWLKLTTDLANHHYTRKMQQQKDAATWNMPFQSNACQAAATGGFVTLNLNVTAAARTKIKIKSARLAYEVKGN